MRVTPDGGDPKRGGPRQVPRSPPLKHTTDHFTIFLHFATEIKNKKQIYDFSESSKSRMRLAIRSLATPALYPEELKHFNRYAGTL